MMTESLGRTALTPEEHLPADLIEVRNEILAYVAASKESGEYDDVDKGLESLLDDPVALRAFADAQAREHEVPS